MTQAEIYAKYGITLLIVATILVVVLLHRISDKVDDLRKFKITLMIVLGVLIVTNFSIENLFKVEMNILYTKVAEPAVYLGMLINIIGYKNKPKE